MVASSSGNSTANGEAGRSARGVVVTATPETTVETTTTASQGTRRRDAPSREERARRSVTAAASPVPTAATTSTIAKAAEVRVRTSGQAPSRRPGGPAVATTTHAVVAPATAPRSAGSRVSRPLSRPASAGCMPSPETRFCSRVRLRPSSRTAAATTAVASTAPAVANGSAWACAASAVARASVTMSGRPDVTCRRVGAGLADRVARATSVVSTKARWPSRCTSRAAVAASAGPTSRESVRSAVQSGSSPIARASWPNVVRSATTSGRPTPGRSGSHGRSRRAMVASAARATGSADPGERSKTPATVAGARRGSPIVMTRSRPSSTRSPAETPSASATSAASQMPRVPGVPPRASTAPSR